MYIICTLYKCVHDNINYMGMYIHHMYKCVHYEHHVFDYIPVRGSALDLIKSASWVSPIPSSAVMSLLHPARGSVLIQ